MSLENKLKEVELLEKELMQRGAALMKSGTSVSILHLYVLGATNRTLSQSKGFRTLISGHNFSCATILLRTQIDTAMRINGIRLLPDAEEAIGRVFRDDVIFRQLKAHAGELMTDTFLRNKLSEDYPWVADVYRETSDFVHLSFRHLWPAVHSTDEESRVVTFQISGEDNIRSESDYNEVCDVFFKVSRITSVLIIGLLMALERPVE